MSEHRTFPKSTARSQSEGEIRNWQKKTKRINRESAKRRAERIEREKVRARVLGSGVCVLASQYTGQACGGPLTPHHLRKASQGGAYDDENLVALCLIHNDWVEDHPLEARALGMVRHAWEDRPPDSD